MFSKLKKSLGFSSKKKETTGSSTFSQQKLNNDKNCVVYDVTFKSTNFGFTAVMSQNHEDELNSQKSIDVTNTANLIKVGEIIPNSEAYKNGVREGDFIVSLDDNVVLTSGAFESFVSAMGRPITIRCVVFDC